MFKRGRTALMLRFLLSFMLCLSAAVLCGCNSSDQATSFESNNGVPTKKEAVASDSRDTVNSRREESQSKQESPRKPLSPEDELRAALITDPQNAQALFRLAGILAQREKLTESLELLEAIPPDHPQLGLPSLGFAGDLYFGTAQFELAKSKYRMVLAKVPNAAPALRHLALILNREGRRHQAVPLLQQLCKLGDIRQDELQALLSVADAIHAERPTTGEPVSEFTGYYPIGPMANARWEFSRQRFEEAQQQLSFVPSDPNASADVKAFYARILACTQRSDELGTWLSAGKDSMSEQAEFWTATGMYLIEQKKFDQAVRANAEALLRDPSDLRVYFRIQQALVAIGENTLADQFWARYLNVRKSIDLGLEIKKQQIPSTESLLSLADHLEKLDRNLEAVMWRAIALHRVDTRNNIQAENHKNQQLAELNQRRKELIDKGRCVASSSQVLCGVDIERFPLPDWKAMASTNSDLLSIAPNHLNGTTKSEATRAEPLQPSFNDEAAKRGLTHRYRVAQKPQPEQFSIYQSMGGGVAVLDYDLNGQPDLYFAQGGSDPPNFVSTMSNQLFRQQDLNLLDVTIEAHCVNHKYTLGVTAGDWDQDGFQDIAFATIRGPKLLINKGDGTFEPHPSDLPVALEVMCTSLAISDVNGDQIPDLIQVNYADDPTLVRKAMRNSNGTYEQISPLLFDPSNDWIVYGSAKNELKGQILETDKAAGLGIIVGNLDSQPGNEVFIANDMYPDNFLKFSMDHTVSDSAMTRGCALGGRGTRTASMGIALADFDRNGTPDMVVTNFEDDSNSLFLNNGDDFIERAVLFKLDQIGWPYVGFGCQAIDYDLNGSPDLAILNGRVEKPADDNHEFYQPTQIISNQFDSMKLLPVQDASGYFSRNHLGRALAKLDFDGDGRIDLVATHLEEQSSLLINKTETPHNWIRFQLIGTESERDSIGAKITIQYGGESASDWITAGNGYMSRNEPQVLFGLGTQKQVDSVLVEWPNGHQQNFGVLESGRNWLIIQNEDDAALSTRP